jgi:hypothetical protein
MSLAALLQAVRDQISEELGIASSQCGIQEDGQPNPGMGAPYFVAVHPLAWVPTERGTELIHALDENYSIGVTITKRIRMVPQDRKDEEMLLKSLIGFEKLARRIMVAIHQNYVVLDRANGYVNALHDTNDDIEGFIEMLRWRSTQAIPTPHDGSWLWEDPVDGVASESVTIVFSEARRVQRKTLWE